MLNYVLVYMNILLINILILNCYNIQNFGFYTFNFVMMISMVVYYGFSTIMKRIKKRLYKFLSISGLVLFISYIMYLCRESLYDFIVVRLNGIAVYLITSIESRRILDFNDISLFWYIVLPFVVWIFIMLCNRKLQIIIFLFALSIGFYLNYAGFKEQFVEHINLYAFLLIFDLVVIFFIKRYLNLIQNENKLEVNYRSLAFIVAFVFISFFMFIMFNSSDMVMNYETHMTSLGNDLSANIRDVLQITDTKKTINSPSTSLIAFKDDQVILGGNLRQNSGIVLTLKTDGPIKYLRAVTRNFYSGFSWVNKYINYSTKEGDVTIQYPSTMDKVYEAKITLAQYGNKRFVAPLYSFGYDKDNIKYNINDFTCESNNLSSSYSFFYYTDGFTHDETYVGRDRRYLQLPPNISEELINLTHEIIKDANTNEEKIYKIVNYLRANCKYSLTVSAVPKDREFVDYFVNNSKKGYCTYFATSVAVMLRIVGIETRYVEGYMVKDSNKNDAGAYVVTNKDAHAWCEARVGNNMWVPVDAVPEVEILNIDFANNKEAVELDPKEYDFGRKDYLPNPSTPTLNNVSKPEVNEDNIFKKAFNFIGSLKWYVKLLLTIITAICIFILYKFISFNYRKNKFINGENINYCRTYFLNHLKQIGYCKNSAETNLEFSETIEDKDIKYTYLNFINKYNKKIYGNKDISFSKEEKKKLFDYINDFYTHNTKLYKRIFSL